MVYLAIKELSTSAEDVIMVTSSILKDMQSNQDAVYRPNAIRALCKIIDVRPLTVLDSQLLTFFTACHGSIRRTLLQGLHCR